MELPYLFVSSFYSLLSNTVNPQISLRKTWKFYKRLPLVSVSLREICEKSSEISSRVATENLKQNSLIHENSLTLKTFKVNSTSQQKCPLKFWPELTILCVPLKHK